MEQATSTVVNINGSVLSSLLFKLKSSLGDAEGFLIGEVCRRRVDTITDSQSSGVREEKKIHIHSFVSMDRRFSFYDHFGRPDCDKIRDILEAQYKNVIGWFSYRRNTSHRISLREKSIHKKLIEGLTHITKKDFLFGLVTECLVDQTPIHSTEYSFHTWTGIASRSVSVDVVNLRASGAVPYQTMSVSHDKTLHSNYSSVTEGQSSNFLGSDGHVMQAVAVENLYRSMLQRLDPLSSQLTQSNNEVISLSNEVSRLQELVDELQAEATKEENESPQLVEDQSVVQPTREANLIDLDSPNNEEGVSHDLVSSNTELMVSGSHDLLGDSIMEPSIDLQAEPLQPLVVERDDDSRHETSQNSVNVDRFQVGNSFVQQSQELF